MVPNDFSETGDWKLTGTPDTSLSNPLSAKVNLQADELCGIRGMSLRRHADRATAGQLRQRPGAHRVGSEHRAVPM